MLSGSTLTTSSVLTSPLSESAVDQVAQTPPNPRAQLAPGRTPPPPPPGGLDRATGSAGGALVTLQTPADNRCCLVETSPNSPGSRRLSRSWSLGACGVP